MNTSRRAGEGVRFRLAMANAVAVPYGRARDRHMGTTEAEDRPTGGERGARALPDGRGSLRLVHSVSMGFVLGQLARELGELLESNMARKAELEDRADDLSGGW